MSCRCFCICITLSVLIIFSSFIVIVILGFMGLKPRFYIQDLYIPAFNNSDRFNSSNINTSIFIHIKFSRVVGFAAVRYEDVNITLFYASNTSFSVGCGVVSAFGQGYKKTVHRKAVVEAPGLPWEDAIRNISGGSTVALAVELATKYSHKGCDGYDRCGYSKPKAVAVAAEVRVDGSGHKVSKKPVRLH